MITPTVSLFTAATVSAVGTTALRRANAPIRTFREELLHGLSAPGLWALNATVALKSRVRALLGENPEPSQG